MLQNQNFSSRLVLSGGQPQMKGFDLQNTLIRKAVIWIKDLRCETSGHAGHKLLLRMGSVIKKVDSCALEVCFLSIELFQTGTQYLWVQGKSSESRQGRLSNTRRSQAIPWHCLFQPRRPTSGFGTPDCSQVWSLNYFSQFSPKSKHFGDHFCIPLSKWHERRRSLVNRHLRCAWKKIHFIIF